MGRIAGIGILALWGALSSVMAFANTEAPQVFTYEGRLYDSSSSPLNESVTFRIEILNSAENCLLYEEKQTLDLSSSEGRFTLEVGSATGVAKRTGDDPGFAMWQVFKNTGSLAVPAGVCPGTPYNPALGEKRKLRVSIKPSSTGVEETLTPNQTITSAPSAMMSQSLQGIGKDGFIQVTANITQANLTTLTNGSDASALHTHDSLYAKLSGAGSMTFGSQETLGLGKFTTAEEAAFTPGLVAGDAGKTWYNSDTNAIMYWDGDSAEAVGTGSGSIASINGDSTSAQLLAVGSTGTAPAWSTAAGTHTLNIPLASTASVTAGLISKADYDNFSSKLGGTAAAGGDLTGNYPNPSIANDAVTSAMILDGQVDTGDLADESVTLGKIDGTGAIALQGIRRNAGNTAWEYYTPAGDNLGDHTATTDLQMADNAIYGSSAASGNLTIDSTSDATKGDILLNPSGGNVGIGTTSPSSNLHIHQTTGAATARITTDDVSNSMLIFGSDTDGTARYAHIGYDNIGDNVLKIVNDSTFNTSTKGMAIDTSGNVGVGTTTPGAKLEVAGQVKVTGGTPGAGKVLTSDASGLASWQALPSGGDLVSTNNLSDVANVATARTNLGLAIGTDVQAYDADLDDLADGTLSAAKIENGGFFIDSAGTAGQVWTSDGVGAGVWSTPTDANTASTIVKRDASGNFSAGTITANLTGNVSGTSANVTGVVAIANGGTGQTTANAAFNALAPSQSSNNGKFLTTDGTNTSWADVVGDNLGNHTATTNLQLAGNTLYGNSAASGDLVIDSTSDATKGDIILNPTSGNVGIGTTTPLSFGANYRTLDVRGGSTTEGGFVMVGNSDGSVIGELAMSGAGPAIKVGSYTNHPLLLSTNNAERMRIDISGNVGIGTSAPGNLLEVKKDQAAGTFIEVENLDTAGIAAHSVTSDVGSGWLGILGSGYASTNLQNRLSIYGSSTADGINIIANGGASNSADIRFYTNGYSSTGYERMRITKGGNVGIGTTTPTAALHLKAGTATAGTAPLKFTAGTNLTTVEDGTMEFDGTNYFLSAGGTRYAIPLAGGATTFTTVGTGTGSAAAPSLSFSGDTDTGFYNASSNDTISIATGGAEIFSLSSAGLVSPTAGGGLVTTAAGAASAPTFSFAGDEDTGWFRPAADTLAASTGGTERVRIDSSGSVGIGTTNPTLNTKLHIVDATTVGAQIALESTDTGGTQYRIISTATANAPGAGKFTIYDTANTAYRFLIDASGNVGIGTTSPSGALHVEATGTNGVDIHRSGSAFGSGIRMFASRGTVAAPTQSLLNDYLGTLEFKGLDDLGNYQRTGLIVGHAAENITSTSSAGYLSFLTTPSGSTTSTERMRIDAAGNVGIGTTSSGTSRTKILSNGLVNDKVLEVTGSGVAGGQSGPFYGVYVDAPANNNATARYGIYASGGGGGGGSNYGIYGTTTMGSSSRLAAGVQGHVLVNSGAVNNAPTLSTPVAGVLATATTSGTSMSATTTALLARNETVFGATSYGAYIDAVAGPTTVIPLRVDYNTSEIMRVTSSGNVGIGTNNPGAKLEIAGQVKITGGTPGAGKVLTSDAAGLATWQALPGGGDLVSTNNLSDVANAATARTNLGLAIGTDVQAYDADLADLADGTLSAAKVENGGFFIDSAGTAGQVWTSDGIGNGVWTTPTDANTASTIVERDGSGNFSAGTITANLVGNVSGTAANVTGTVAIANGGTGQTTANAAFNALTPSQGSNGGKFLTTDGTNTSWTDVPGDDLGDHTATTNLQLAGNTLYGSSTASGDLTIDSTSNATKGDVLVNPTSGNVGIGTTTPGVETSAGRTYLSISGSTSSGFVEFLTGGVDADMASVGGLQFTDKNSLAADKRVALISSNLSGATANNRGGALSFYTKVDGSSGLNSRMTITSDGDVGIGTTTPTNKLVVQTVASQSTDGIRVAGPDGHYAMLRPSMSAGANNSIVQAGDTGVIYTNGTIDTGAFVIAPWASGTSGIRMDSSGNVGIGTTSPGSLLDVVRSSTATSGTFTMANHSLTVSPTVDGTGYFRAGSFSSTHTGANAVSYVIGSTNTASNLATAGLTTYVLGAYNFGSHGGAGTVSYGYGSDNNFSTSASTGLVGQAHGSRNLLNNSGSVSAGYGALNSVQGAGAASVLFGSNNTMAYSNTSGTLNAGYGANADVSNASTGTITNAYGVNALIRNQNAGGTITSAFGLMSQLNNTGSIGNWYGLYIPAITNTGTITNKYALFISDTSKSYIAGNVGIGVTNSTAKLSVSGVGGSVSGSGIELHTTGNASGYSGWAGRIFTDTPTGSWGTAPIVFSVPDTSGTEVKVMTLLNGNVGIGTNNPGAKLEVAGQVKITGGTPGAGKVLTSDAAGLASWQTPSGGSDNLGNHTATTNLQLAGNTLYGNSTASGDLTIDSTSDATKGDIILNPTSGNVGIGTAAPAASLHVSGQSIFGSGATASTLSLRNLNDTTGSSSYNLENNSGTVFGRWRSFNASSATTLAGISLAGAANLYAEGSLMLYANNDPIYLATNNTSPTVTIATNGNVGIGTTTPGAKLEVQGTSGSTLKIVDGNQAAGKVLTSDVNGQASWQMAAGGLTAMTAVNSTSGTSIDFTSIPSGVKRITVMFQGVSTNGNSGIIVQLGDSGGVETTGYLGSMANTTGGGTAMTNLTTGLGYDAHGAGMLGSGTTRHGTVVITNITGNSWVSSTSNGFSDSATIQTGGSSKTLSATLDSVRITTVGGTDTFDAGVINVIYEQ